MTQQFASEDVTCLAARDMGELLPYVEALEDLAAHAIEPNVYYEPWMLIPAAKWLGHEGELRFVVALSPGVDHRAGAPGVIGFFPVETSRHYDRFPLRTLRLWKHEKCFLCVPLLRAGWEYEALQAFLDWTRARPSGGALIEFDQITTGGPFHRALVEVLARRRQPSLVDEVYVRSVLTRANSCEAFLQQAVSSRHRRDMERKERKLARLGRLEYAALEREEDLAEWVGRFLEIESGGWKGEAGTALTQVPGDAQFFREVIAGAHRRGRLTMLGLRLEGRLIAIKCNLRSGPVGYAFMIAFDDQYSAHSPGLLLEMENIRQVHRDPEVSRMDSCADPGNTMFSRIWNDKMLIQRLIASDGTAFGNLRVASIPLLRCLIRVARAVSRPPGARPAGNVVAMMPAAGKRLASGLGDTGGIAEAERDGEAGKDVPVESVR
ncbi:MAG: GNAT family N-acetyltransferase [Acidobacteria bacterium]|nr:GNAT family N-acetyltransferase [Acidobacteriota bacterium]